MREWIWRLGRLLRPDRTTVETREELQFHLDMEVEAGLRSGLSPEAARRRARWRAGQLSDGLESTRAALGIGWIDGMRGDLRHAARALTRNPGFGTVAILVLAATVAVNTLIFFMLEGVVLRALPYQSPERLVRLYDAGRTEPKFPMSIGHYLDYRASAASLDGLALYTGMDMELSASAGHSRRLTGVAITSEYFTLLGKAPLLGRVFTDDDLRGGIRHVVLSARAWRSDFQADPAIVGKAIRLNREPWTVIGVAPEGFQHVGGDYRSPLQGETVDVWLPLRIEGSEGMVRFSHYCNAIARIRTGYTASQAGQELAALASRYNDRYPKAGRWGVRIEPLLNEVTGRSSQVVWLLTAAGGLVLLVACANIAGLSVARAVSRRRELSLRRALGANRWQLVRVGLTENLLIGMAGAVLGLALAWVGLPLLRQLLPEDFPRAHEVALTVQGALFAAAIALTTVLVAGLLASGGIAAPQAHQRVTAGRDAKRLRTALVVGEIALAGVLCAGDLVPAAQLRRDWRPRSWLRSGQRVDVPADRADAGEGAARISRPALRGHPRADRRPFRVSAPSARRPTCRGAATTRTPVSRSSAARPSGSERSQPRRTLPGRVAGLLRSARYPPDRRSPVRSPARRDGSAVHGDCQRGARRPVLPGGTRRRHGHRRVRPEAADCRGRRRRQGQPHRSRGQAGPVVPARPGVPSAPSRSRSAAMASNPPA